MASRVAVLHIRLRFSSGGRILSEEEKAAVLSTVAPFLVFYSPGIINKLIVSIIILYEKGPKAEEKPDADSAGTMTDAKPSSSTSTTEASTEKVSTDRYRNYMVLAGVLTFGGAVGWYLDSREKKQKATD